MARDDWFQNQDWNSTIEGKFFEKLRHAREKQQYLRIQASMIARQHPRVALHLLEQYFELGDHFDLAHARVSRAVAYLKLGFPQSAIAAYEAALAREKDHPRLLTYAYLDLPFLIASIRIHSRYEQALDLLEQHRSRLMFPADYFRWHAAFALIASADGKTPCSREHAHLALAAAEQDHSGFRYHPSVGLVDASYDEICKLLSAVCA